MNLKFSRRAQNDYENIIFSGVDLFGESHTRRYIAKLDETFKMLQSFPMAGTDYSHLRENLRKAVTQSHIVFYKIDPDAIFIIRILHHSQDPKRHV